MIVYVVENTTEESVTVDGLGVLPPKESIVVKEDAAATFKQVRGLGLAQVHMPKGVELTVTVLSDNAEEGK